jgi:hypothetical protein
MMQNKKRTSRGVTLIETILYLGIAVLVMGAFFSYGWDIVGTSVKESIIAQTSQTAQDVEQRIDYEIRKAQSVSEFSSTKVVLQENGDTVAIEYANGAVTIKRGSADAVTLNATDIIIDNFAFTRQQSNTNETQYVGFSFDAVAAFSGSATQKGYQYLLPVQSGASLRTQ